MEQEQNNLDFSFVLASSVHDMKNSLGMLLSSLESMLEETPPQNPVQQKYFSTLGYEASRINGELVQLLALYRMQQDAMQLRVEEQFILDLIEDQVARNDVLLSTRGIELQVDCDPDLSWYLDSELIGGVLNNILVNGARYSRGHLQISARVERQMLCLSIADDGKGFPQAMLDAPLQENAGVSFSNGSTNLGLLFAHQVAGLHRARGQNGYIELSNGGVLEGGVFSLWLP